MLPALLLLLHSTAMVDEIHLWFTDALGLRFIYHYKLASYFPNDDGIFFSELGRATGVDETLFRLFVQHAIVDGFFKENSLGFVSHSAALLLLKQSGGRQDTAGFLLYEIAPVSVHVIEAMLKRTHSGELTENDFNIAEKTSDSLYHHLARDVEIRSFWRRHELNDAG